MNPLPKRLDGQHLKRVLFPGLSADKLGKITDIAVANPEQDGRVVDRGREDDEAFAQLVPQAVRIFIQAGGKQFQKILEEPVDTAAMHQQVVEQGDAGEAAGPAVVRGDFLGLHQQAVLGEQAGKGRTVIGAALEHGLDPVRTAPAHGRGVVETADRLQIPCKSGVGRDLLPGGSIVFGTHTGPDVACVGHCPCSLLNGALSRHRRRLW